MVMHHVMSNVFESNGKLTNTKIDHKLVPCHTAWNALMGLMKAMLSIIICCHIFHEKKYILIINASMCAFVPKTEIIMKSNNLNMNV